MSKLQYSVLAETMTPHQIADYLGVPPKTVWNRLSLYRLHAIPARPSRPTQPPAVELTPSAALEVVAEYFGRPVHMTSVSFFARDRIVRGVALEIVRKFSRMSVERMAELFGIPKCAAFEDIRFAAPRAKHHVDFLTTQITAQHDKGTERFFEQVREECPSVPRNTQHGKGMYEIRAARESERVA
jgi:hypothetical protein